MIRLFPLQEVMFQKWYANLAQQQGISTNPDDPEHFYDYRKAFLSYLQPNSDGHLGSQFKKIGHPRMFLGGVNTQQDNQGDYELQYLIGRPSIMNPLNRY